MKKCPIRIAAAALALSVALSSCTGSSEEQAEPPTESKTQQTAVQEMRDITASELVKEIKAGFSRKHHGFSYREKQW